MRLSLKGVTRGRAVPQPVSTPTSDASLSSGRSSLPSPVCPPTPNRHVRVHGTRLPVASRPAYGCPAKHDIGCNWRHGGLVPAIRPLSARAGSVSDPHSLPAAPLTACSVAGVRYVRKSRRRTYVTDLPGGLPDFHRRVERAEQIRCAGNCRCIVQTGHDGSTNEYPSGSRM